MTYMDAYISNYPLEEIWLPIPEFPRYQASNFGRIKSIKGSILKQSVKGRAREYYGVLLRKDDKEFCRYTHRLIAQTFIPNPDLKREVNHKDCNKKNNNASNLEWCTRQENMVHATENRLILYGENQRNSKLNDKKVIEIRKMFKDNPQLSQKKIAKEYNIHSSQLSRVISGKYWKHIDI